MSFSGLCRIARKLLFGKSVYKIVSAELINNHFISSATLYQKNYLSIMPPKRKTAASKQAAAKSSEMLDEAELENDIETTGRASRKRAIKKQTPPPTPSESEPSDSDSGSDYETPKKPAKKARKPAKKPVASRGRKKAKKEESEEDDVDDDEEEEEAKPARGRKKAKVEKDVDEDDEEDEEEEEPKPVKGRKKAKAEKDDDDEDEEDEEEEEAKPAKGRKKAKAEKDVENGDAMPAKGRKKAEKKAAEPAKNKTATNYTDINFDDCSRENSNGEAWNFKISNWNVDGIRAWIKKGGLEYLEYEKPDVFCLQETKCSLDKLPPEVKEIDGYKAYWHCSAKDGYAGVALYSKIEPVSVEYGIGEEEHDDEGRIITAEYDKFYVISVYVPNAGRGLVTLPKRLKWNDVFRNYVAQLDKKKPVIVCGDMNVAHLEIDLANPKTNTKNAGFTKEERDGMTDFLGDGYVDTFREIYPDKTQAYTFWTYMANCRAKNVGWRLDYFIVSERFMDSVCDNIIRNEVFGSDHCPVTLFLNV